MIVGSVVRHERALAAGLDEAVAATVLHRIVLNQDLDALGPQAAPHEVAERARTHGAEQHRGLSKRMSDGECVECAPAERHLLSIHDNVLRRLRQLININHHIGACHSNEQQLSHGGPSSIRTGSGPIIANISLNEGFDRPIRPAERRARDRATANRQHHIERLLNGPEPHRQAGDRGRDLQTSGAARQALRLLLRADARPVAHRHRR
ncbi:Uncharacterised protein [Collinsella intestinalis]|nr:Uncharacterised protein [Collinsella intestinalis]